MADIFFFADQAEIDSQKGDPGAEAFGPVGGSETTQFRVTSLHKGIAGANPAAYAVCKGRVRVQADVTDSTLLTLVLTPDVDVLRGVPIRFFVYRGVRRDSLIDSTGALLPGTLTNRLLNDKDSSNDIPDALGLAFRPAAASPPSPEFAREDIDPIDTIFFETTTLKAIPVQAGDQLGKFDGAGFGFEIMLGTVWGAPTLKLLRSVLVSGNTPQLGSGNILKIPPNTPLHVERALREKVYGYLDPCAFYGICLDRKKRLKYKTAHPVSEASAASAQVLYDQLLVKFHNRNRVYLDVRNDNGLSYNYYDTYGAGEILLDLDTTLLKPKQRENPPLDETQNQPYATHGWPLKIIDASSFKVPPGVGKAGIRLAMNTGEPLTDTVQRQVFFEFASLYYNARGKNKGSGLFEPAGNSRIADVRPNVGRETWTHDLVLGIPTVNVTTTAGSATLPIASYARLHYLRQNEQRSANAGRYISTGGQWDNVFVLQSNLARWQNNNFSSWWLTGHLKYIPPQLENQQVYKGVVEAGVAVDRDPVSMNYARYTFYYVPVHVVPEPSTYRVTSGGNAAGTGGSIGATNSFFQRKESGQLYDGSGYLKLLKISEFKGSGPPVDPSAYLSFLTFVENPQAPDPLAAKANRNHSKESLYALSFSAEEYETILNNVASQGFAPDLHPVFLQVRGKLYPRSVETATERVYQALELRIVGFNASGSYLSFDIPSSGAKSVRPLSLHTDGIIFCTNDAALFEPLPIMWNYNAICIQIRDGSIDEIQHARDVLYFGRAIADIKRYHAEFYGRMERLQLLGAEVVLHDKPGIKQRHTYRIEVMFDSSMTAADPSGETAATNRYKGVFPEEVLPVHSNAGFRITQLDTLPSSSVIYNRYGEMNATRYVDLNRNRSLNASQVNELFLRDYTDAEIGSDAFDSGKLYVESYWNPAGSGAFTQYKRITLAKLKNLGFGALDPAKPITIRINRTQAQIRLEIYEYTAVGVSYRVPAYNERQVFISSVLAHELGHAEMNIREPLISYLWAILEGIFNHEVDWISSPIVEQIDTSISKAQFRNWRLKKIYPNPPIISKRLYDTNPALDTLLHAEGFLAETGDGHLRGSPNAQNACLIERVISEKVYCEVNFALSESFRLNNLSGFIPLYPRVDYCFLNFEDADLNP